MQTTTRRKKNAAFTIFEVAMAAAVMAFALATSLIVMGRSFAHLDTARCLSYASQIMQSELEKMRLTPWGTGTGAGTVTQTGVPTMVTAYPTTWTNVPINATFTTGADIGSRMTMTRIAADAPGHTAAGSKGVIVVTLKIQWTTFDRRTLTRSYTTYYGQNGLYDFFVL